MYRGIFRTTISKLLLFLEVLLGLMAWNKRMPLRQGTSCVISSSQSTVEMLPSPLHRWEKYGSKKVSQPSSPLAVEAGPGIPSQPLSPTLPPLAYDVSTPTQQGAKVLLTRSVTNFFFFNVNSFLKYICRKCTNLRWENLMIFTNWTHWYSQNSNQGADQYLPSRSCLMPPPSHCSPNVTAALSSSTCV